MEQADPSERVEGDPLEQKRTYVLKSPINVGGKILSEITCREPSAAELEGFRVGPEGVKLTDIVRIAAKCSGTPLPYLMKMKARDAFAMTQHFADFFGLGIEDGASG